jgi:hypothetical protein
LPQRTQFVILSLSKDLLPQQPSYLPQQPSVNQPERHSLNGAGAVIHPELVTSFVERRGFVDARGVGEIAR